MARIASSNEGNSSDTMILLLDWFVDLVDWISQCLSSESGVGAAMRRVGRIFHRFVSKATTLDENSDKPSG